MGNQNQGQRMIYTNSYIGPNGIIIIENPNGESIPNQESPPEPSPEPSPEIPIIVDQPEIKPVENVPACCAMCHKKLKLVYQFKCRCENMYCPKHMHSFDHNCTFDYKKLQKEKLMKDLAQIGPNKLKEI